MFYVYLFHPRTKGATVVYDALIKPVLLNYESKIDDKLGKIGERVN